MLKLVVVFRLVDFDVLRLVPLLVPLLVPNVVVVLNVDVNELDVCVCFDVERLVEKVVVVLKFVTKSL